MSANRRVISLLFSTALAVAASALVLGCARESKPEASPAPAGQESAATPDKAAPAPTQAAGSGKAAPASSGTATTMAAIDQMAPDFSLTDVDGKKVKLSDYKGKTVVLEWFNPQCPFVKYAHGEGPLKDKGKIPGAGDENVVWLAINSGAPGKQGHGKDLNAQARTDWGMNYPVLIDESGKVGKMYEAKTTPHMYVVNPSGKLVYRGALDNAPLGRVKDGSDPVNYVKAALADLSAGKSVGTTETKSYGCSVKY